MFRSVTTKASVIACNTCRHSAEAREDGEGVRGGARLTAALKRLANEDADYSAVDVEEMPCLFACSSFCTVYLRAPGKVGYVLGKFAADDQAARAILEFSRLYAESEHGQVPYKRWPDGVKGHFLVRVPPEGQVVS
jgi:predicted metal-binding protein